MEEEAFEETKVVEALDRLDAVVLQPEALQVRVLLQVLDLGKALNKSFTKFHKTSLTMTMNPPLSNSTHLTRLDVVANIIGVDHCGFA